MTDKPTITRAMTQDAVRALGLDPTTVSAVTLERHTVTVTHIIPVVADRIYEIKEPDAPKPTRTVRHRDAITGQYVDADEAEARPETTIRETRKSNE